MRLGELIPRLHPFRQDVAALADPPFDPRRQSWAEGALAAIEAFVGAILTLPALGCLAAGVHWVFVMSPEARSRAQFHHVHAHSVLLFSNCTVLAGALLWAGLALMFGWRTRYRAQGLLGVTVLAVVALWLGFNVVAAP